MGHDEFLNHLLTHIAEEGVTVVRVEDEADHPPYSHTIGLTGLRHPEVVATGLERRDAAVLLNVLGHAVAGHGFRLGTGRTDPEEDPEAWPEGWPPCWVLPLYRTRRRLATAVDLFGPGVTGVQVVWPDLAGRFPWEPGYGAQHQPLLCRPPSGAGRLAG